MSALPALVALVLLTSTPVELVARLQARLAVSLAAPDGVAGFAGLYVQPPPGIGGLAGSQLYLFSDHRYYYCEWSDMEPLTIRDKGQWTTRDGFVHLSSDADVLWSRRIERDLLPVRLGARGRRILLVGGESGVRFVETTGSIDPVVALSTVAWTWKEPLPDSDSERLQASLMEQSWHPGRFPPESSR